MHVLMLCGDPGVPLLGPSAASAHLRAISEAFVDLGAQVTVLVARESPPSGVLPAPLSPHLWVEAHPPRNIFYPFRRWPELRELRHSPRLARAGLARLQDAPPDLIYERMSLFTDAGLTLARGLGVPHLLEVNAPLTQERARFHGLKLEGLASRFERRIATGADACLAVSSPVVGHLRALGVRAERVHLLPNGVDTRVFVPRPPGPPREGGGPHLIFAGGFRKWHGLELLPPVWAAVRRASPQARLTLVGDGPVLGWLLQALGGDGVSHAGRVAQPELARLLASADLALVPPPPVGLEYFCPLKVMEAMACAVPVLGHDRGDVPSLLGVAGPQAAGLVLPWHAPERAADCVAQLWRAPARRAAMAAAGPTRAQDWRQVAERILALGLTRRS